MGFVQVKNHDSSNLGIGKLIEVSDLDATVSWFDSPVSDHHIERIQQKHLQPVILEQQTRIYWLDRDADVWRVGRVLDADELRAYVRFPNFKDVSIRLSELEVRWDRPISDPCTFLAAKINESPLFAEARTQFTKSLIEQRGASSGMSALISSVIDLEQHQYEVVKRVLQDPVQRYLLADEVGLGKTVEAGVLIRQYVIDNPADHSVLVITPPSLMVQWRRELRKRFLLGDLLDDSLLVMSMGDEPTKLLEALQKAGMVVIDEAHHLSEDHKLYSTLREMIIAVPRVLLLSATPVLHNERGFLEVLHLLDPDVFKLEEESVFRELIENRQVLAETVAGLVPENLLQIEDYIDDLLVRFPNDPLLQEHLDNLRNVVIEFPEETDDQFIEKLRTLRAHLTETYRLDRRILRNRRRDLPFLTPERAGVERVTYSSSEEAELSQAIESWRNLAADSVYNCENSEQAYSLSKWFRSLLEAAFVDAGDVVPLVNDRLRRSCEADKNQWEIESLKEIQSAAVRCNSASQRFSALLDLVQRELQSDAKLVVFCSTADVADIVAKKLEGVLSRPVDRHELHEDPEDDDIVQPWEQFLVDSEHRILICDSTAEEGVNLQGGEKVVIHYDLPLAPNRVEQRLGRVDRYGSGGAIRSYTLCCDEDPYNDAWVSYLENGLMLFRRSVASLQYVIEEEMQGLTQDLFLEGVDALKTMTAQTGGDSGTAARELRRIDDQDALDALALPDESESFELLTDVDSDWRGIADAFESWLVEILQTGVESRNASHTSPFGFAPFRLSFSYKEQGGASLIPLKRIFKALIQVLDIRAPGANPKLLKTDWYSCRRGGALGSKAPNEGVRLVRWGDTLVDRVQELTNLDDRGRAAAMWRRLDGYIVDSGNPADVFLRFDFIVEANINSETCDLDNNCSTSLQKALVRRGDMAFPPFYKTIWLDENLSIVTDPETLRVLEAPYRKSGEPEQYQDWNLNSERWSLLQDMGIPIVDAWHDWIAEARTVAEKRLRTETDLEKVCEDAIDIAETLNQGRFAQLNARIRGSDANSASETKMLLESEFQIAESLYSALRFPRITLGTVCAIFLAPESPTE
jgi:ATP-dependent helicase HepA